MNAALFFRMLARQLRGARARVALLAVSVAIGVTAVVSVLAITNAVESGIRARSRELLGGDLAVESRRPLPDVAASLPAAQKDAPHVRLWALSTMARGADGRTRLVELKAVDQTHGRYPLAGTLTLDPPRPLDALLDDHSALVAPELLSALALKVGDTLYVGGQALRIAGLIVGEPDPIGFSFTLGPRVLITGNALLRTSLLGFGNRVRYRTVFAFPKLHALTDLRALKQRLVKALPGGGSFVTVEVHDEAQPALRQMLSRVEHYASLVALLSLLVAGVGVAQTVSAWLRQAAPETAVLRCLGFLPRDVFALYLAAIAICALLGSVVGASLGSLAPRAVSQLRPELLPISIAAQLSWPALWRGLFVGTVVPLAWSLYPLTAIWRAAPVQVLRSDSMPLRTPRGLAIAFALIGVGALYGVSFVQSDDPVLALAFALGISVLALSLIAMSRALAFGLARLPRRRLAWWVWHGVAALTKPGSGVVGSVLALGLGTLIVLSIALSSELVQRALSTALPERAPTMFLMDIQPDQWPGVEQLSREAGGRDVDSVPVVMARMRAINERPVSALIAERAKHSEDPARVERLFTREQRLSWTPKLPPDNRVVAGELWSDPRDEVSVEQDFAKELGIQLGDTLRFDIQGVPRDFVVTSLRSVVWRSFSTNFFVLVEPGSLEGAPYFRLAAMRAEGDAEGRIESRLVERFPNVTVLRVRKLIERADEVFAELARGVQLLGAFAVVSGLFTLGGSVASSQLRRRREVALLKTLGVSRMGVVRMFALEYALHGSFAGFIGAAAAYVSTWIAARQLLELTQLPSMGLCLVAVAVTTGLAVIAGLAASMRALWVVPMQVLRGR